MGIKMNEVGYCGNDECPRIQVAKVKCEDPDCSKQSEGEHFHCPECEELL